MRTAALAIALALLALAAVPAGAEPAPSGASHAYHAPADNACVQSEPGGSTVSIDISQCLPL